MTRGSITVERAGGISCIGCGDPLFQEEIISVRDVGGPSWLLGPQSKDKRREFL